MALADDVGLNWQHSGEAVLVVKALPSRVGAGPLPLQLETAEEDARGIAQYGVNNGDRRRKTAGAGAQTKADLTPLVRQLIDQLEDRRQIPITLCDCGKNLEDLKPLG